MANYPGTTPYEEDPQSDEEAAVESSSAMTYRRLAASSDFLLHGPIQLGVDAQQPPTQASDSLCLTTGSNMIGGLPEAEQFMEEARSRRARACGAEHNFTTWDRILRTRNKLSEEVSMAQSHEKFRHGAASSHEFLRNDPLTRGKFAAAVTGLTTDEPETPLVMTFPSTFRLERTNFVATSPSAGQFLSVDSLVGALRSSLAKANVDVLDYKPAHCVLECSFHVGNRFLSMNVRVFRAPDRASGQLLDTGNGNDSADENETPFVVEAQLREGDRLHFSTLFREITREFENQEGVNLAGTFRYHPRPYPATGEGLALEEATMAPSRNSIRSLAEREETMQSGRAGLDVSPPPLPASMAKIQGFSELNVEMMDDVVLPANMLRGNFLDVQADAATAVAGLTSDPAFLEQLYREGASKASNELRTASVRLLVETQHRFARRQAAVVVANFATTPLRAALPVLSVEIGVGVANKNEEEIAMRLECIRALVGLAQCQAARYSVRDVAQRLVSKMQHRVEALVVLSVGIDGGGTGIAPTDNKMSRGYTRALAGFAECQAVRCTTEQVEPNNKTAHCADDPLPVEGASAGDGVDGGSPPLDTVAAFVGHEPRGGNGSNKREDSPPQRESCVGIRTPWMTLKATASLLGQAFHQQLAGLCTPQSGRWTILSAAMGFLPLVWLPGLSTAQCCRWMILSAAVLWLVQATPTAVTGHKRSHFFGRPPLNCRKLPSIGGGVVLGLGLVGGAAAETTGGKNDGGELADGMTGAITDAMTDAVVEDPCSTLGAWYIDLFWIVVGVVMSSVIPWLWHRFALYVRKLIKERERQAIEGGDDEELGSAETTTEEVTTTRVIRRIYRRSSS